MPVCSPELARRLRTPADFGNETILRVNSAPDDWANWLAAAGLPALEASLSFATYAMALQAAVEGVGVAMALDSYVAGDLDAGRLVAPFRQRVPKGMPWALVYKPNRRHSPELVRFRRWLLAEAKTAHPPVEAEPAPA